MIVNYCIKNVFINHNNKSKIYCKKDFYNLQLFVPRVIVQLASHQYQTHYHFYMVHEVHNNLIFDSLRGIIFIIIYISCFYLLNIVTIMA